MKSRVSDATRLKQGRGKGDRENYLPFFRIRDFSSMGRTHRPKGQKIKRHFELFSDLEYYVFCHLDFADDVYDIKEQFNLNLDDTIRIARQLNIKHPPEKSDEKFIMTSDFLVIKNDGSKIVLSVKPISELKKNRVIQKLQIEFEYWRSQGVQWHLITENELNPIVLKNLRELREAYVLKLNHIDKFLIQLRKIDWKQNVRINEVIKRLSIDIKITYANGRSIFLQLLAKKIIKFDYTKAFSTEMPLHNFMLTDDTTA
jgi:hypothetical protein